MRFRSRSERDRHRSSIGSNLSSTFSISSNSTTATGSSTPPSYPTSPPTIPCRSSSNADKQARFRATIAHLTKLLTSQPHAEELASSWYGTTKMPSVILAPSISSDKMRPPKPRARTSSVPAERPAPPFAPPISPRGSSSRTFEPATGTGLYPPPTPITMTLQDLKRLLDSERRVSASAPGVEEQPLHSSASAYRGAEDVLSGVMGESPVIQRGIPLWIVVRTLKSSWHADGSWPILACNEPWPPEASPSSLFEKGKGKQTASRRQRDAPPRSIHTSEVILRPPGITSYQVPLPPPDLTSTQARLLKPEPGMDEIARRYRVRGIAVEDVEKRLSVLDESAHGGENGNDHEDSEADAAERPSRASSPQHLQSDHEREKVEVGRNEEGSGIEAEATMVIPDASKEQSDGNQEDDEGEEDLEADTTINAELQTHLVIDSHVVDEGQKDTSRQVLQATGRETGALPNSTNEGMPEQLQSADSVSHKADRDPDNGANVVDEHVDVLDHQREETDTADHEHEFEKAIPQGRTGTLQRQEGDANGAHQRDRKLEPEPQTALSGTAPLPIGDTLQSIQPFGTTTMATREPHPSKT